MNKNKAAAIGLIVFLCIVTVYAADDKQPSPTQQQSQDGGIALIYNAIQKNTEAVNYNTGRIEAMNEILNNQYQRWLGIYLLGNAAFMTFLYSIFGMIDSYNKKRKLKKTEEYIHEQNRRIREQDKSLLSILQIYKKKHEETQIKLNEYLRNIEEINAKLKAPEPVKPVKQYDPRKITLNGIVLGWVSFALVYIAHVKGWF